MGESIQLVPAALARQVILVRQVCGCQSGRQLHSSSSPRSGCRQARATRGPGRVGVRAAAEVV